MLEWAGALGLLLLCGVLIVCFDSMGPKNSPWFSYGNEPEDDCPDCNGTGIINEGDEHFECECPCTTRIYY